MVLTGAGGGRWPVVAVATVREGALPYSALYAVPGVVQVTVCPSPMLHTIVDTRAVAVTETGPADAEATLGPYVSGPVAVHM